MSWALSLRKIRCCSHIGILANWETERRGGEMKVQVVDDDGGSYYYYYYYEMCLLTRNTGCALRTRMGWDRP